MVRGSGLDKWFETRPPDHFVIRPDPFSEPRLNCAVFPGRLEQRRIELDERPLNGCVLRMALDTPRRIRNRLSDVLHLRSAAEVVERPAVGELRVLHLGLHAQQPALKAATGDKGSLSR